MAKSKESSFGLKKSVLLTIRVVFACAFPIFLKAQNVQDSAFELANKGKEAFLIGYFNKAILLFNEALRLQPNLKEVNYQAALAEYNLKEYEKAIPYFTAEIKNNAQHINSYIYRGISKYKTGHPSSAIKDLNRAIEIDAKNELAHLEKGNILLATQEFQKAITEYSITISLNPKLELAYYNIGWCFQYLKNTASACMNWRKIADMDDFEGYEKAEKILNENSIIK